jgi:ABC-2 type transport system permease protein
MMKKIRESLYIAWTITAKDVREALTNRATRTNILVLIGLVLFFYWSSTIRPFDKRVEVVVYDQGESDLSFMRTTLQDGSELEFRSVDSIEEMKKKMAYQDLGLVVPADFKQDLNPERKAKLVGYVHWVSRNKVADLETQYSTLFTEMLGNPVQVEIGENILIPPSEALGMASTASFHVFFAVFWMAMTVVPFLILEERKAKTMEALMVSPASPGQVVLGKALAGLIFVIAIAGLSLALNGIYVVNWGWALLGFLLSALFAIGLALLFGSLVPSGQQITLWMLPIILVFLIPGFFADEPNLAEGLKSVLSWFPSTALARILGFSVTNNVPIGSMVQNLVITLVSIVLVYAAVIWQVRRSDR